MRIIYNIVLSVLVSTTVLASEHNSDFSLQQTKYITSSLHVEGEESSDVELLSLLEASIEATNPSGTGFLTRPVDKNPLCLFKSIANEFEALAGVDKPWKVHSDIFVTLAMSCIEIVDRFGPKEDDDIYYTTPEGIAINLVSKFREEVNERRASKTADYEWLLLFADRCSILATRENERVMIRTSSFNTRFDQYKDTLMKSKSNWYTDVNYREAISRLADVYGTYQGSLLDIARYFPSIVCLPYPFELDAADINKCFPALDQTLWPLGFAWKEVDADGVTMNPGLFIFHDAHHLVVLLTSLQSVMFSLPCLYESPEMVQDFVDSEIVVEGFKKHIAEQWGCYRQTVSSSLEMIDAIEVEEKRQMYNFFHFYTFHEFPDEILTRLNYIFSNPPGNVFSYFSVDSLLDPKYYFLILPEKYQALAIENKEQFENEFEHQRVQYRTDLAEHILSTNSALEAKYQKVLANTIIKEAMIEYFLEVNSEIASNIESDFQVGFVSFSLDPVVYNRQSVAETKSEAGNTYRMCYSDAIHIFKNVDLTVLGWDRLPFPSSCYRFSIAPIHDPSNIVRLDTFNFAYRYDPETGGPLEEPVVDNTVETNPDA